MGKWSRKFSNILTAAGISLIVAAGALAMPIEASAARTVTDDVMIRNDASTEAGIIGSLNEGDEVTILDVTQSADGYAWYYIQLENNLKRNLIKSLNRNLRLLLRSRKLFLKKRLTLQSRPTRKDMTRPKIPMQISAQVTRRKPTAQSHGMSITMTTAAR